MGTPDVIRHHRTKLRLTQSELAKDIGVDTRQINRYETGATEPNLAIARRLAERLQITMDELAGATTQFSGTWWSAWHGLIDNDDTVLTGPVELSHTGRHLSIQPDRNEETPIDIAWSAEIYVDAESLLGGYKITTNDHRAVGLLNLTHYDNAISGDWIKTSLTKSKYGKLALATDRVQALERVRQVKSESGV